MSPAAHAAREAFIAEYGICSTNSRLYGLDELVASIARHWHVSRTQIRTFLTSPAGVAFLRGHRNETPSAVARDLPFEVVQADLDRRMALR